MKVLVLGAGVIGITTAYYLAKKNYQVTIIDKNQQAATESSFANGGHLGYSSIAPGEHLSYRLKLFSYLTQNLSLEQELLLWNFINNSNLIKFIHKNNKYNLELVKSSLYRLALSSKIQLNELINKYNINFAYNNSGILHLYFNHDRWHKLQHALSYKKSINCDFQILNHEECLNYYPQLQNITNPLAGGLFFPQDAYGDCYLFCQEMVKICQNLGVKFLYEQNISKIELASNKIAAIISNGQILQADNYIAALGAATPLLLNSIDINTGIFPLKGYSVTIDLTEDEQRKITKCSIVDQSHKLYYSMIGNKLKISGTQENIGYNYKLNHKIINIIFNSIKKIYPHINLANKELNNEIDIYPCLRPSNNSGFPIIGQTKYSNLYINSGHAGLGWTLALGSSQSLVNLYF